MTIIREFTACYKREATTTISVEKKPCADSMHGFYFNVLRKMLAPLYCLQLTRCLLKLFDISSCNVSTTGAVRTSRRLLPSSTNMASASSMESCCTSLMFNMRLTRPYSLFILLASHFFDCFVTCKRSLIARVTSADSGSSVFSGVDMIF